MTLPGPIHATLVARFTGGMWRGVLLRGPSGVGKSDLALRLVGQGWRLVADDRVLVWRSGDRLWGRAPQVLKGLLELRGIGVMPFPALDFAEIALVVDCVSAAESLERVPDPATVEIEGVDVPIHRLAALHGAAADQLAALCDALRL